MTFKQMPLMEKKILEVSEEEYEMIMEKRKREENVDNVITEGKILKEKIDEMLKLCTPFIKKYENLYMNEQEIILKKIGEINTEWNGHKSIIKFLKEFEFVFIK